MAIAFASTRSPEKKISFKEAVFRGLAPDGGLYHLDTVPDLRELFRSFSPDTLFTEIAGRTLHTLLPQEFSREEAQAVCERAFPFSPVLRKMDEDLSILELFHGPSCAFKDFGASFLAAVMDSILAGRDERAVILTATSGDTGSAVARAFYGSSNIDVVILYPSGRVSPLQEKQLTTLGGNISALEVKGSFDDCQRMVKEAFVDRELIDRILLSSANSINLGRLLPQSFYYIWAAAQVSRNERPLLFCVPSGNFGNLTAGVLAWSWGLEVERFIAATNVNDVVPEYLESSIFTPRPSVQTYSNAMDVGDPSNFERLLAIFGGDWEEMSAIITGDTVTDAETLETIAKVEKATGEFLCPHTAVGYLASRRFLEAYRGNEKPQIISLGTAAPGKFTEIVEQATGKKPPVPEQLAGVMELEKKSVVLENSLEALKEYLLERFG
ncbi:threonine synthase [Marispirochaeta aestuarii]|uniref:threonine synthase n=1 Tax=Marispirochaeta aestuarii TaxID=1963862 RepID=UPI0029C79BCA|nr:threonine synthase [Marispirochaeta aestuarii]